MRVQDTRLTIEAAPRPHQVACTFAENQQRGEGPRQGKSGCGRPGVQRASTRNRWVGTRWGPLLPGIRSDPGEGAATRSRCASHGRVRRSCRPGPWAAEHRTERREFRAGGGEVRPGPGPKEHRLVTQVTARSRVRQSDPRQAHHGAPRPLRTRCASALLRSSAPVRLAIRSSGGRRRVPRRRRSRHASGIRQGRCRCGRARRPFP